MCDNINVNITLGQTRDLGMEHVDSIDFMLKSSFCQLSIKCSLTIHSSKRCISIYLQLILI